MSFIQKPQIKKGKKLHISGGSKENLAISLMEILNTSEQESILIITDDVQLASSLSIELKYLIPHKKDNIYTFPDLEILPYDNFSTSENIISERMRVLYDIQVRTQSIIIAAISTILKKLPPKEYVQQQSFSLNKKQEICLTNERKRLEHIGYNYVEEVFKRGEFNIRGGIIDIFPMGAKLPYRVELFDNEIDTIRTFDIDTQRSIKEVDIIDILPSHEFTLTNKSLNSFAQNWDDLLGPIGLKSVVYSSTMNKRYAQGIEFYTTLFNQKSISLLDYICADSLVININDTYKSVTNFWDSIIHRYEQLRYDKENPILPPESIYYTPENLFLKMKNYSQVHVHNRAKAKSTPLPFNPLPCLQVNYQYKQPYTKLLNFINKNPKTKIIFSTESQGRKELFLEKLQSTKLHFTYYDTLNDAKKSNSLICLTISPLINGFEWLNNFILISEKNLFKNHIPTNPIGKEKKGTPKELLFNDLTELNIGDAIVHIEHGIGTYQGLSSLNMSGQENEYLTLLYANDEKLYVPIHNLDLINRYSGTNIEQAPRNKLGSDKWEKTKEKALKKVQDIAAGLLDIYAKRSLKTGYSNTLNQNDYLSFCQGFPFEETQDQAIAIKNVIDDMIAPKPMDRLICGDVGFGKTEVAMRASYLATYNNKQVAILTPTTLLTQQHYENFNDRFALSAINIVALSRFQTVKQQNEIISNISKGKVDIVIGTHKLLSDKIKFNNLGLLIIDEEHRFGVTHKEKIKALRANIDILTMTATPIPRTLNMAFSSIRDLSIIATPPALRRSVKTFVHEYNTKIIEEAVYRETLRGGQVYFLHNNVKTILKKSEHLEQIFPNLNIACAHGQMREKDLESIMYKFQKNDYQILVCTTIIETGIDIPNANTIIIERSDNFGLAQLHQLRGRVGRSPHQAYAYLLTPPFLSLKKDAIKRLNALKDNESLGAGFILANHDLEIRGAGELLGKEQSGNIEGIGFNLYIELLNKTTTALKAGKTIDNIDFKEIIQTTEIELRIPALIPNSYIYDVHTRLTFYKRISSATTSTILKC
jgi:transcription-repair coupling factor (superfamily II helicase)